MKCKKILHLLKIFALLATASVYGQSFKAVDFERLLKAHPLIKKYDPKTHRFRDTKSEPTPVKVLKKRQTEIDNRMKKLAKYKSRIISDSLQNKNSEKFTWDSISKIDVELKSLKKEKAELIDSIAINGDTEVQTILPILQKALSEVIKAARNGEEKQILINKLPRYRCLTPPKLDNGLRSFIRTGNRKDVTSYLRYSPFIGLMFKHTDQTILFEREAQKK